MGAATLEKAEYVRNDPKQIVLGGWVRAINIAGEVIDHANGDKETRTRAALIALIAAEDWMYRSGDSGKTVIENRVINPIKKWYSKTKECPLFPETEKSEFEMWAVIEGIRSEDPGVRLKAKEKIGQMPDNRQTAVLVARVARETGDMKEMDRAIGMLGSQDDERMQTLKRWKSEMRGWRRTRAGIVEKAVKAEYQVLGLFAQALIKSDFKRI